MLWSVAKDSPKMVPAGWSPTETEYKDGAPHPPLPSKNHTKNMASAGSAKAEEQEGGALQPASLEGTPAGPCLSGCRFKISR